MGRPEIYTKELAEAICLEIATSNKGIKTICENNDNLPSFKTVFNWLNNPDKAEFLQLYTRAREIQAEYLADEILQISDDATNDFMTIQKGDKSYEVENKEWTSRSKLRVEARKWVASKLKPKKFGDKLDVTSGDKPLNQEADLSNLTDKELEILIELQSKIGKGKA